MEDLLINGIAILAGLIVAKILFTTIGKKTKQKQSFMQEYHNVLNNPEYKVKRNN